MNLNKKTITYLSIGVAVLAVIILAWYLGNKGGAGSGNNSGVAGQSGAGANAGTTVAKPAGPVQSATRQTVSANIAVPDASSTVSSGVAKPNIVAQAAPGTSSKFRKFSIEVSGNKFTPDTVIVNMGDTVHLDISATDKSYDFYQPDYGLSQQLGKGETKTVEFQANANDKYTFYCKSCGGPDKGPVGYVVVVPAK